MEAIFSKEIQAGLDKARVASLKRASRLRVSAGGKIHPILRMWKSGFAMEAEAPSLRGRVDLYDGSLHLMQCLIIASDDENGERRYEFKRATAVSQAPAVDFEIADDAPVGLIEDAR
ncbi:hypothetical protein [uncultured Roseobacter sp.]|uniref:hypothetical protein n=1 Tax=uncultured Roseobacter sp. TaxID=114847 RepID=UPI00261E350A|nr:hypothetical protein [uncultured Roseobacter sp.]